MGQSFIDNCFEIDLSYAQTPADIVFDLSSVLDNEDARNKKINLKIGDVELNQAQLLSLKSLINSINSSLTYLETPCSATKQTALEIGIVIDAQNGEMTKSQTPEQTYKSLDDFWEAQETAQDVHSPQEGFAEQISNIPLEPEFREYEKIELEENMNEHENVQEYSQDSFQDAGSTYENTQEAQDTQDMQEQLDTIFDAEKKLDDIFDQVGEIQSPETKSDVEKYYIEEDYTEQDYEIENMPTKYLKQTIRSGQAINFEGNIIIIGDAHPGCELSANGDITVWGVLGGIAHAGSCGNEKAKIRALKMNAIQLRIANCYARRPDVLNTIFAEKTNTFTPEEARIIDGEIVIFKTND